MPKTILVPKRMLEKARAALAEVSAERYQFPDRLKDLILTAEAWLDDILDLEREDKE